MGTKIVIVGGVAGGASAAAKARRVDEHADIVLFEKGPYVSFANCGLPYYIGGQIEERESLFLQTPENFWNRFRVRVNVLSEVMAVNRSSKSITVKNLRSQQIFSESYDKLVLAPGAGAIVPPLPGIRSPNVFTVKTVPDSDAVRAHIEQHHPQRAVVVGAGFIGLESVEALKKKGMDVTLIELLPQVLPPFDSDMAAFVSQHLDNQGVHVILGDGLKALHGEPFITHLELNSGKRIPADLVILSIGVRPELKLAKEAGLDIGPAGGIAVDEHQQTSDPSIFAAGDAAEVLHLVSGKKTRIPLAGPANKQGRVAGANAAGELLSFPGALGTAIVETLGIVAAKTGLSEKEAAQAGLSVNVSLTHSLDHAGYYPGSSLMHIKLLSDPVNGQLKGAQIVGEHGVDKRIDVLATALSANMTVTDLEQLDLAYAPQFSSAKDPVVMAGFVASNVYRHELKTITCDQLQKRIDAQDPIQIVDVRTKKEYESGHLAQAHLIPIDELRERLHELDKSKETIVYCRVGLRGYLASRILTQHGFSAVLNLTGGILMCPQVQPSEKNSSTVASCSPCNTAPIGRTITVKELSATMPLKTGLIIDVRFADEYRYERIPNSKNIPLDELHAKQSSLDPNIPLYVACQTGIRSAQAVSQLRSSGFQQVILIDGGLDAWKKEGFATQRTKGPIPIMRQVQIIAGSLVVIGALTPHMLWLSAFVGVGLVVAGSTGFCGMAKILGVLPWNKTK